MTCMTSYRKLRYKYINTAYQAVMFMSIFIRQWQKIQ